MAPTTQKSLTVPEAKADWKLVNNWPVLTPGPNELLVKVVAVSINPVEVKIQAYGMPFISYPHVGGLEGAGIVDAVGSEVTSFAKGDKVLVVGSFDPRYATFKEYTLSPADNVAKIPDNITFEQAAAVPVAVVTVACGTWAHHPKASSINLTAPWEEDGLTKYVGQPAFISGGSSSVGQAAIQFAKLQGFTPIITTASLRHADYLKSLGATAVLDRTAPPTSILASVLQLTGGQPVPYAYDAIGDADTQNLAYDVLGPTGRLVVTIPDSAAVLAEKIARDGGAKMAARPTASLQLPENKEVGRRVCAHLTQWLQDGTLKPDRVEVIHGGFEGVAEACKRHASGQVSGVKLVVKISED